MIQKGTISGSIYKQQANSEIVTKKKKKMSYKNDESLKSLGNLLERSSGAEESRKKDSDKNDEED